MSNQQLQAVRHAIKMEDSTPNTLDKQLRMLGRYRILEKVGQGATALVYRAYDPQLDRFIAIKVLKERLAKDDDYRESFVREARLAAQLTHPNIVTIFDVGVTDGMPYIAMELLEGATLEEILKAKGKLPIKTVLAIANQLALALVYAHQQGVVHRDIKAGNILILRDKKTTKLTDFGIAQIDESLAKAGKLNDKVLGTPEYMSPEQILGQMVDHRSDLYSTGVLIYRMISGLPPFIADDLGQLFKQIIKSKHPEIILEDSVVKDDIKDLLRKLLQKLPEKRFQNASILVAELRQISAKLGKKKIKKQPFFSSLTTRWSLTMVGAVFVSMCIGLIVVYWMQYRALSAIAFDFGHTVGQMIARQSSEAILLEDNIGLNALIRESVKNEQLESIIILDSSDLVLAASQGKMAAKKFIGSSKNKPIKTIGNTRIFQRTLDDGRVFFDVSMPIYFSDKKVGKLLITYSVVSIYRASNTTLVTMLLIMLVTLFIVSFVTIILAKQTAKDYKRVTDGLRKMSMGRVDARIMSHRSNEAGQLFVAFNQLAAYFERVRDNNMRDGQGRPSEQEIALAVKSKQSLGGFDPSEADTVEINIEQKTPKEHPLPDNSAIDGTVVDESQAEKQATEMPETKTDEVETDETETAEVEIPDLETSTRVLHKKY